MAEEGEIAEHNSVREQPKDATTKLNLSPSGETIVRLPPCSINDIQKHAHNRQHSIITDISAKKNDHVNQRL